MKIRIKGNSVRYRLTRSEVSALAEGDRLEDKTEFISGAISYSIEQIDSAQIRADFVQNRITLYMPKHSIQNWASTDKIGIEYHMPIGNDKSLYLLLEKDFKCIDADVTDDQSDYFDNPQISC